MCEPKDGCDATCCVLFSHCSVLISVAIISIIHIVYLFNVYYILGHAKDDLCIVLNGGLSQLAHHVSGTEHENWNSSCTGFIYLFIYAKARCVCVYVSARAAHHIFGSHSECSVTMAMSHFQFVSYIKLYLTQFEADLIFFVRPPYSGLTLATLHTTLFPHIKWK